MNLNGGQIATAVKGIKESISSAISHDIADKGNSVAELIDEEQIKDLLIRERKFDPNTSETDLIVIDLHENEETGEVSLKLNPINGDTIYYEIGQEATLASLKREGLVGYCV